MDNLNSIDNKILVSYLITKFDTIETLQNFVLHYKKFQSGVKHDLLICFKLLDKESINKFQKALEDIHYITFIDNFNINDYDFGSYKRIAEIYSSRIIFFLNSHSYPICDLWLKKVVDNFHENSVVGTTASCESLLSSAKLKKVYKIISFIFRLIKLKNKFNNFPNPHIRTTGILIKADDYLSFMKDKYILSKEDAWELESGKISLTNFFKSLNYKIYVVNSDGNKFEEIQWKLSETYNYLNQQKSIISDKHTRKYLSLDDNDKNYFQNKTWDV